MSFALIMLVAGLLILGFAGDRLVRGSVSAALNLGVSQILASIVIVGFGTSAPEMLVAIEATISGAPGMAMGNIIGSNIANVFLVLGIPGLFTAIYTTGNGLIRSVLVTGLATLAWLIITPILGLTPLIGVIFLAVLITYMLSALLTPSADDGDLDEGAHGSALGWIPTIGYVCIGLIGLPLGAHLTISSATQIAQTLHFSEELIGLTILAVGTSLPELSAALAAAARKESDVILGDVAGSNLFNLLGAGGIIALFGPISLPVIFAQLDFWFLGVSFLFLFFYVGMRRTIGWLGALTCLSLYLLYLAGLFHFYILSRDWNDLWTLLS